jgi:hypothetical protein
MTPNHTRSTPPSVKILSLGQCLQYGYEGVSRMETYEYLAEHMLRARFPHLALRFELKHLYHPIGLKPLLKRRLLLSQPDIVIIGVPATFAASYIRVNRVYEMAPEIVDTARDFLQRVEARIRGTSTVRRETVLDDLFGWHPPLSIAKYEQIVESGIRLCQSSGGCRVVILGPGRFNEDTTESYENHSPEVWDSVNEMTLRLGERHGVAVISSFDVFSGRGGEVFLRNNHRWSVRGHEIMAREVEHVIASQIAGQTVSL